MNRKILASVAITVIALAGAVTNASAQGKTRAEVRQELIEAQNNGLQFVTDQSYPEVAPIYAQQVARMKQQSVGGAGASGATQTGKSVDAQSNTCVGPVSFCTPYSGG
jgi:predicted RNase H-like HicB family nuclease